MARSLRERYGRWALVAGASEGLGAAYARALAAAGMDCALVARRGELLEALAGELREKHGVETRCIAADLAAPEAAASIEEVVADLEVGMLVYNAAYAPAGDFGALDAAGRLKVIDVNVRGPVSLIGAALPRMLGRGRGAILLMSSLAGNQGSPRLSLYAASKAFNAILAEGLWRELRSKGVDVLACCAGAVRTPGYAAAAGREAPGTLAPEAVVRRALAALGKKPRVVPGLINKVSATLLTRLLPRRAAIAIMAASTRDLAPTRKEPAPHE